MSKSGGRYGIRRALSLLLPDCADRCGWRNGFLRIWGFPRKLEKENRDFVSGAQHPPLRVWGINSARRVPGGDPLGGFFEDAEAGFGGVVLVHERVAADAEEVEDLGAGLRL